MLNELKHSARVVGVKQLRKALERGTVVRVFLADNADPVLLEPLEDMARAAGVPVCHVAAMKELGQACGIAVGAAAAGILAPQECR